MFALIGLFLPRVIGSNLPNPVQIVRKRVEKWAIRLADDYIMKFLAGMKEHPETVAAILEKPVGLLVDRLIKKYEKELPAGNLAGEMVSTGSVVGDVAQAVLPVFGKKGKMAAMGLRFLPFLKGRDKGNTTSKNPFEG